MNTRFLQGRRLRLDRAIPVLLIGAGVLCGSKMVLASEPEMETFTVSDRAVNVVYPKGWRAAELREQHPYAVAFVPAEDKTGTGGINIRVLKYYHASASLDLPAPSPGMKTPEQLLDKYSSRFIEGTKGKVLKQETASIRNAEGQLLEMEIADDSGASIRALMLIAVKEDVLAVLGCQAPAGRFENYRGAFEAAIRKSEIFSVDPNVSDNKALDEETENIWMTAQGALQTRMPSAVIQSLNHAVRINPAHAAIHVIYGNLLWQSSQGASKEGRDMMVQDAEEHLLLARNILDVYIASDPGMNPFMSRTYFLLAEIAEKERGDLEYAKMFYKAALKYSPDDTEAQEALKRYGGT